MSGDSDLTSEPATTPRFPSKKVMIVVWHDRSPAPFSVNITMMSLVQSINQNNKLVNSRLSSNAVILKQICSYSLHRKLLLFSPSYGYGVHITESSGKSAWCTLMGSHPYLYMDSYNSTLYYFLHCADAFEKGKREERHVFFLGTVQHKVLRNWLCIPLQSTEYIVMQRIHAPCPASRISHNIEHTYTHWDTVNDTSTKAHYYFPCSHCSMLCFIWST